jgi:hypothetical protein
MYTVSATDHPIEITSVPQSSVGAPCPAFVAAEHSLRLVYYLEEDRLSPEWQNVQIKPEAANDSDELCALVVFSHPYAHMFGPPNDEAFTGHPLASRGLEPYSVYEVAGSSWIKALEQMNSVHPYHRAERFSGFKHYIFSFHDSTFECVAQSFSISLCRGSVWSVLRTAENEA